MHHRFTLALGILSSMALSTAASAQQTGPALLLAGAEQALVVLTDDWSATAGRLVRWERSGSDGRWERVGDPVPVVVGRSGLGWGVGLHPAPAESDAPVKREGDGRAPAGAFRLGSAFGYAPAGEVGRLRLPYLRSTAEWKCVDDPASAHYNRVLDESTVRKDWESHEEMLRKDHLYRLGAVVEHNWGAETRPGAGSCIFLHVWRGPGHPTVGCTAMEEARLAEILRWLDAARRPVLVQLPRAEYRRLREAWRLPG